mmetsp:Transcript_14756/g.29592  ORF Transcript_14756/g.29592 Transcript_14756/m.29592 type:complete len:145 (+) Transcript_14756:135-569(+)
MYRGFPNPVWDPSEHDQKRNVYRPVAKDAEEARERAHEGEGALAAAGVKLSGMPWEEEHAYNSVDGLYDKLVPNQPTPKYRASGVAEQEQPQHFLLQDAPFGEAHTQREGINNLFGHGKMDAVRQAELDEDEGYEEPPSRPTPF